MPGKPKTEKGHIIEHGCNATIGVIGNAFVRHRRQFFLISTVNLMVRRILEPFAEIRDVVFNPPFDFETMVWETDKDGNRMKTILHCAGYKKKDTALKRHKSLCYNAAKIGKVAFNGRQFQTKKLDTEMRKVLKRTSVREYQITGCKKCS